MAAQLVTRTAERYRPDDHLVWSLLHRQQAPLVAASAVDDYLDGLDRLGLPADHVPDLDAVNDGMAVHGDWRFVGAGGMVDGATFFGLLADRRFPVTVAMRRRDELAFAELPDLFHDLFGHGPYLANPRTADLYHRFGRLGSRRADDPVFVEQLQRLLWATLEVGLVQHGEQRKAIGGAILSSASELARALAPSAPAPRFDLDTVLAGPVDSFRLQQHYFVLGGTDEITTALDALEMAG
ncbi:phenylalanine-4-hydroxylase [Frankia sp. AiPs1]|uniref:hypothetical protein n=1 Tax=Frankia sp. AiPa1 TaxID=573492 RepID=UPI00202B00F8|nr:hypothetical protein [Frankia sp. AiPa1]MCL9758142.1 hypothetical protein [Frankia sp. AiPa1]